MQQYAPKNQQIAPASLNAYDVRADDLNDRLPGNIERTIVGSMLCLAAAVSFSAIIVGISISLEFVEAHQKIAELWLGLSFLPVYFAIRHIWQKLHQYFLPTVFDFPPMENSPNSRQMIGRARVLPVKAAAVNDFGVAAVRPPKITSIRWNR